MKPKTKKFFSNFFLGLFSNDQAIEGSKSNPWWVALIIALLGIIIPIIPITVSQSRSYGASFLSGYTRRFDQNIASLTVALAKENKDFEVGEDKLLTYIGQPDGFSDSEPVARYQNQSTGQYELSIYYTAKERSELKEYITDIDALNYKKGTIVAPEEGYEGIIYAPSYVVLAKNGIYTRINNEDSIYASNGAYTAFSSDWKHFKSGDRLIRDALDGMEADNVNLNNQDDVNSIFNNWKDYYNKSYLTQKTFNVWMTSLLFLGIYAILVFILGLLVFLLTRGKNNMFNYLKFMDTQKIVYWACLCPGLLAMIVGFILPSFSQMAFIMLLGLRVMWISMKQLRPQY